MAEVTEANETGRLEAFSDGVLAVIITIMVLEIKEPEGSDWHALRHVLPVIGIYLLSFAFVGIYWNNHHHLLRSARRISPSVMWSNLHLLFWLSLIPFVTQWSGTHLHSTAPAATYAIVALGSALAYTVLQQSIIRTDGDGSVLPERVGNDLKGRLSLGLYLAAFGLSFVQPWISYALFVAVSVIWFVPDKRLS